MSIMLEALKRSEEEHRHALKSRLKPTGPTPGVARNRAPWAFAIAALLCVNAVLIGVWMQPSSKPIANPTEPAIPTLKPRPKIRSLAHEAALVPAPEPSADATPPTATAPPAAPKEGNKTHSIATHDAPPMTKMPESFQQQLPALDMQIHVYSANPADRFVMINMHRYVEGDTLEAGPKVVQIQPGGVVLEYRGRTFLLPTSR